MNSWSLKQKLLSQVVLICVSLGAIAALGMYLLMDVSSSYSSISKSQFPKVEAASRMVAKFRLIRIKVRSLAVTGNTAETQRAYIQDTKDAIGAFLEEKKTLESQEFTAKEQKVIDGLDESWGQFLAFGSDLLSQYENPTPESMVKGAYMIREICPIKARAWMSKAEEFVEMQSSSVKNLVNSADEKQSNTIMLVSSLVVASSLLFIGLGFIVASRLSNKVEALAEILNKGSNDVHHSSQEMLANSSTLSESSSQAASSLQETVSSIDEISSMIRRNADSAKSSTQVSAKSSEAATRGKATVETMIASINDISKSNDEIAAEMQRNNKDISKIVEVISEIGEKTKVINDIVFQTKLLSFNASVEAARAGEHGKGFAVVAEEVGNLASMSGKAALEITEMLDNSIKQVTNIVEGTKKKVEVLVTTSKDKVQTGTQTAHQCGEALNEILQNVNSVNEMVREISSASTEQSTGVQEVTKAMQMLDQTTHKNTSVAQESSAMAESLKLQADSLSHAVGDLLAVVGGQRKLEADFDEPGKFNQSGELISFPGNKKAENDSFSGKRASGSDIVFPED